MFQTRNFFFLIHIKIRENAKIFSSVLESLNFLSFKIYKILKLMLIIHLIDYSLTIDSFHESFLKIYGIIVCNIAYYIIFLNIIKTHFDIFN